MAVTPTDSHRADADPVDVPAAVEHALEAFLDERLTQVAEIGPQVTRSARHLREFVLGGGKRIRPLYAWAGFTGTAGVGSDSGEDPEAVLRAISSLELIQACALIHDDIIDASDSRRGNPTVHRSVESRHRAARHFGDSERYGRNEAILIGDLALIWAEDMWRYSGVSKAALDRAAEPWRGMRTEVIGGQLLDIVLEAEADESVEMATKVNRYKTAAYTIERPLHLGAALAGAPEPVIDAYRGYGRDIGIAFQLRDDLLGVFGDENLTGKPAGDDLREGKRTVLLARALARLDSKNPAAAQRLRDGVGRVSDPEQLHELAALVDTSGAVADVEADIERLTASGLAHLDKAGIDATVAETLGDLAVQATRRRA